MMATTKTHDSAPDLTSKEVLREATVADKQAVLDFDKDIYYGLDYLAAMFTSVVQNPNIKSFVYEKEGAVVGFLVVKVIDGGQTLVTSAGRMRPDTRGQGMYGRFNKRVQREMAKHADLRYLTMSVNNYNMESFNQRLLSQYTQVQVKDITIAEIDLSRLRDIASSKKVSSNLGLRQLGFDDVKNMMLHQSHQLSHLFLEERFTISWTPFRLDESNATHIINQKTKLIADSGEIPDPKKISTGMYPITLMSSGDHHPCQKGSKYLLDIYGNGSNESVLAHIEWHMMEYASLKYDDKGFMMIISSRRVEGEIGQMAEKSFPIRVCGDSPFRAMHVLEKPFPKDCAQ